MPNGKHFGSYKPQAPEFTLLDPNELICLLDSGSRLLWHPAFGLLKNDKKSSVKAFELFVAISGSILITEVIKPIVTRPVLSFRSCNRGFFDRLTKRIFKYE
jgi:hypothetical protein